MMMDRSFGFLHHLTPFRALLQLYAYEEVFTNHKLDRAFPSNNNRNNQATGEEFDHSSDMVLSFYAPQLLCFLLHNAYLNTGRLERWILHKSRSNVYFAHKCYWFIRSWCLHSSTLCLDTSSDGIGLNPSSTDMITSTTATHYGLLPDTYKGSEKGLVDSHAATSSTSLSSLLDGWGKKSQVEENEESIISAEERQLMIGLLGKIMVCFIFYLCLRFYPIDFLLFYFKSFLHYYARNAGKSQHEDLSHVPQKNHNKVHLGIIEKKASRIQSRMYRVIMLILPLQISHLIGYRQIH